MAIGHIMQKWVLSTKNNRLGFALFDMLLASFLILLIGSAIVRFIFNSQSLVDSMRWRQLAARRMASLSAWQPPSTTTSAWMQRWQQANARCLPAVHDSIICSGDHCHAKLSWIWRGKISVWPQT